MKNEILLLNGIKSRYRETEVLEGLFLEICLGEIQYVEFRSALEKESLFNILSGNSLSEGGSIILDGKPWPLSRPLDSQATGIFCTHAEHTLVPSYTVAENMFLVNPNCYKWGLRLENKQFSMARRFLDSLNMNHIDIHAKVRDLDMLDCCIVEIAMAIHHGMRLIVLNDLLEKLTNEDMERLSEMLTLLKHHGIGFLCLSNMSRKSEALLRVADQLTVVKNGRTAAIIDPCDMRMNKLPGSPALPIVAQSTSLQQTPIIFSGNMLHVPGAENPFSFELHKGEVLGIGCSSYSISIVLSNLLTGITGNNAQFFINGKSCRFRKRSIAARHGIALVRASYEDAVFTNMDITQNISIMVSRKYIYPYLLRKNNFERYIVQNALSVFDEDELLQTLGKEQIRHLSAYHQFIISLSRCIAARMPIIILVNPQMSFGSQDLPKLYDCISLLREQDISVIILSININLLENACNTILTIE